MPVNFAFEGKVYTEFIRNIGNGGVYIESDMKIPAGKRITFFQLCRPDTSVFKNLLLQMDLKQLLLYMSVQNSNLQRIQICNLIFQLLQLLMSPRKIIAI